MSAPIYKIIPAVKVKATSDQLIKNRIKKELMKKLADAYKFHDPCAHIRSVGNGL